jgi:hypothetical protein
MALVAYVAVEGCLVQKPGSRHDGPARYLSTTDPYLVEELSESGQRMAQRALRGEVRKATPDETAKAIQARDAAKKQAEEDAKKAAEKAKANLDKKNGTAAPVAKSGPTAEETAAAEAAASSKSGGRKGNS